MNKKKFLNLLMLSAALITAAIVLAPAASALVSSGDNPVATKPDELTAQRIEVVREERVGDIVFPRDQVHRDDLSIPLPGAFLTLDNRSERSGRDPIALRDSLPIGVTRNASLPAHNNANTVAGHNASQENIEVEVVMARANGFEPAVITRPHGPFVLGIHNQSGAGELVLRLDRAQGGQLQEVRLRTGRRRQHQLLDLPIGEYILSEATHSRWRCQIIITR